MGYGGKRKQTDDEARLVKAKADREEIKVSKEKNELLNSKDVEKHWSGLCLSFRNKMLAIPMALSGELAEADSAADIEVILKAAINESLTELADGDTSAECQ